MVKKINYRNLLLYALLAVQVIWLLIHIFLSSQGWINQWKLGGYGMYTGPSPQIFLDVLPITRDDDYTPDLYHAWYDRYQRANYGFGLYCLETNPEKINIFFTDNPMLVGKDVQLIATGHFMTKYPIADAQQTISNTHVWWINNTTYRYKSYVPKCDHKIYGGTGTFIANESYGNQ